MNESGHQPHSIPESNQRRARRFAHMTRCGFCFLGAVIALIAVRMVSDRPHLPDGIEPMVKQLSSARILQRNAVANHAGTMVGVVHTTEDSVGVYLVNVKTQDEIELWDAKCSDYRAFIQSLNLLGWSPDDDYFAYTVGPDLILCNGATGEQRTPIRLETPLDSLAWLSPDQFVYLDTGGRVSFVERSSQGWEKSVTKQLPEDNGKLRGLVAMSANQLAWHSDNRIWTLDVASGQASPLFVEEPNRIVHIDFSRSARAFLVTEATPERTATFFLGEVRVKDDGTATDFVQWEQLERATSINNAQWFNGGQGYIYRMGLWDDSFVVLKRKAGSPREVLFAKGRAWDVYSDGESPRAYAMALKANEPAGFWELRADTEDMRYAFSPWGKQTVNFPYQPAFIGSVARDETRMTRIEVVPPVNYSRHKKYPLVISFSDYEWSPLSHAIYAQALAHSGVIVALVPYRNSGHLKTHTNTVLNAYAQLTATGTVNTDRVYLAGFSAGTDVIKQLVEQFPGRWRGVMIMSPTSFPDPKPGMVQQVLLTAGSVDRQETKFPAYREDLCKVGIPATWYIHENEHHSIRGQRAFYERTMMMLDMVFER